MHSEDSRCVHQSYPQLPCACTYLSWRTIAFRCSLQKKLDPAESRGSQLSPPSQGHRGVFTAARMHPSSISMSLALRCLLQGVVRERMPWGSCALLEGSLQPRRTPKGRSRRTKICDVMKGDQVIAHSTRYGGWSPRVKQGTGVLFLRSIGMREPTAPVSELCSRPPPPHQ